MAVPEPSGATLHCARHPRVETVLRCGRCETPICPNCLVYTPVGARCPDCGRSGPSPIYQLSPALLAQAIGAAIAATLIAAIVWALAAKIWLIGFFILLVGLGIGYGVGKGISRAARYKRGPVLMVLAGLAAGLSFILGLSGLFLLEGAPPAIAVLAALRQLGSLFTIAAVAIAVFAAVSQVR